MARTASNRKAAARTPRSRKRKTAARSGKRAQPDRRKGIVIQLGHAARRLPKRGAVADFRLDVGHSVASSPCKDQIGSTDRSLDRGIYLHFNSHLRGF